MSRTRSLITGGAGFVGSHLVDRLMADGHEVLVLDSLQTGRRANIRRWIGHERFTLIEHDVIDPWPRLFGFDRVYHLACAASPAKHQKDPIHTMRTSVEGTLRALEVARASGARFFLASTSEVYGDPTVHPQPESYRGTVHTTGPRACYDEGKRAAEALTSDFARMYGVDVRIARIFNTYGPRMDPFDGRVITDFVRRALEGEPLRVFGDGTQTRSFCYVSDLVEGIERLMTHDAPPLVTNLGNDREVTIGELARRVHAICGGVGLHFEDLPEDDPLRRRPDLSRAREFLDYEPQVPLNVGLAQVVARMRAELGLNRAVA